MDVAKVYEGLIKQSIAEVEKTEKPKDEVININLEEAQKIMEEEKEPSSKVELSKATLEMMKKELENMEKSGEGYIDFAKLMEIARRIAKGDKVPASDHKKLLEADAKLYQSAKMQALLAKNKDPKEHEALFEDEEDKELKNKLDALKNEAVNVVEMANETVAVEGAASSGSSGEVSAE